MLITVARIHNQAIRVPKRETWRDRNPSFLEERYALFKAGRIGRRNLVDSVGREKALRFGDGPAGKYVQYLSS